MGQLRKRRVWGGLAVGCAVSLAACGSSHHSSNTTRSASNSKALEFASCMRAHGVPSFPDPSGGGSGFNFAGNAINPQSPAFKSARQTCGQLAPGRAGGVEATQSEFLAALRFAKCMRTHGFSDFPDPTRFDSPPGPILIIGAGLFFRVSPGFNANAPAVKQAVSACGGR
jgi:hypothetical protein